MGDEESFKLGCTKKKDGTGLPKEKRGLWECTTEANPLAFKLYMDDKCTDPPSKYTYYPEGLCHGQGGSLGQVWWKYVCIDGKMEKLEFSEEGCTRESQKPSNWVIEAGSRGNQCQLFREKYGADHGCDDGGVLRTTHGAKDKPKDDD